MTRTALVAAGIPACFWPYAAPTVCFNKNCQSRDGTSAWYRTHKKHFGSELFPFGCGVWFLPSPTTGGNAKWEPRASYGVFAGYRTTPGYNWRGDYLVWDLE